jgi:hypothetical protein
VGSGPPTSTQWTSSRPSSPRSSFIARTRWSTASCLQISPRWRLPSRPGPVGTWSGARDRGRSASHGRRPGLFRPARSLTWRRIRAAVRSWWTLLRGWIFDR